MFSREMDMFDGFLGVWIIFGEVCHVFFFYFMVL